MELTGQWIGRDHGADAQVVLDLDEAQWSVCGLLGFFPRAQSEVAYVLQLPILGGSPPWFVLAPVTAVARDGRPLTDEEKRDSGALIGDAELEVRVEKRSLHVRARAAQKEFFAELNTTNSGENSLIEGENHVRTWDDYKSEMRLLEKQRYAFRGQGRAWPLQTAFHRSRRKDLNAYVTFDILKIHQATSAILSHAFDLRDGDQTGSFYSLIQHHGYPTPLLDWTYSPFIAAWFAYRSSRKRSDANAPVRVYAFDAKAWHFHFQQQKSIARVQPHFSVIETLAIENKRLTPQQGLSTLTNLHGIEHYISYREHRAKTNFLRAYDLDYKDRDAALYELSTMGVTAASMFPGLDGVCEALRGQNFGDMRAVPTRSLTDDATDSDQLWLNLAPRDEED